MDAARLWRYRDAHRLFWWKSCGFVVGGAQLDSKLEDFWRRLGFAVIEGYGLTETAPMVTWNHPFKPKPGTVGKPLEGIDVRIADESKPSSKPISPFRLTSPVWRNATCLTPVSTASVDWPPNSGARFAASRISSARGVSSSEWRHSLPAIRPCAFRESAGL